MTMPALFVGHGSPMNTLEKNRFTESWRDITRDIPMPRAILAVSAHWFVNVTAVTSMAHPRIIHDFYGFPQELFDFDYPAPGSPEVAKLVAETVKPTWVGLDDETWGIDHGTWSVLAHMYPEANVPVVQLAIDASKPLAYHLDLGAKLAGLRDEGILIVGSGNVVHNLGALAWRASEQGFAWAERFDAQAHSILDRDPSRLGELVESDDFRLAVPTHEHFLPLAYLAGLASISGEQPRAFVEGCTMGSLSMTSYIVGGSRV